MLNLRAIREDPDPVRAALARRERGLADDLDHLIELDGERRKVTLEVEDLRAEQNRGSKAVGSASGDEREQLITSLRQVSGRLAELEPRLADLDEEVLRLAGRLPNPPHESVPEGESEEDNEVQRMVGEPTTFAFEPKDHVDLGQRLGIIDLERGARVSGSRFTYLLDGAVWIQWALVRYCMDLLGSKGFVPVVPPVLVREEAMYGTGFLPAAEAQIYVTRDDDLYLAGTSEVPLAALHQDEILDPESLPRRYAGYSTCFRREAGTYGKDIRGIFRLHQFDKVEMFSLTAPEMSWDEHEFLLSCQEKILGGLSLPYRLVLVCSGQMGNAAAKQYDIEVWLPGQGRYRELTSCSNCTDYQARRLECRVRFEGGNQTAHTLNGTACAVGRTLIALLENFQQEDGSVPLPESLHPYLPEDRRVLSPEGSAS
ncbi:MAG TPA: serine--tRNA ligase [Actinomycetota bacterium]|nr:serine--tRNA ligase [Actinomycetota bacterium]